MIDDLVKHTILYINPVNPSQREAEILKLAEKREEVLEAGMIVEYYVLNTTLCGGTAVLPVVRFERESNSS